MKLYKTYSGEHFPKVYLVIEKDAQPEKRVPFNVLYLFGHLQLVKGSLLPSHLPFSKGGQKRITDAIEDSGFCFYKWPGKILGPTLGDVLDVEDEPPPGRSVPVQARRTRRRERIDAGTARPQPFFPGPRRDFFWPSARALGCAPS